jgi:hypothetical protein
MLEDVAEVESPEAGTPLPESYEAATSTRIAVVEVERTNTTAKMIGNAIAQNRLCGQRQEHVFECGGDDAQVLELDAVALGPLEHPERAALVSPTPSW